MKRFFAALMAAVCLMFAVPAFADETAVSDNDILSEKFVITDYLLVKEYLRGPYWDWLMDIVNGDLVLSTQYDVDLRIDAGGVSTSEIPNGVTYVGALNGADMFVNNSPMYRAAGPLVLGEFGTTTYAYDNLDSTFTSSFMFGTAADTSGTVVAARYLGFVLPSGWYDTFTISMRLAQGAHYATSAVVGGYITCSTDTLDTVINWMAPWGYFTTDSAVSDTSYAEVEFNSAYPIYIPASDEYYTLIFMVSPDDDSLYTRVECEFEDSVFTSPLPFLMTSTATTTTITPQIGSISALCGMLKYSATFAGSVTGDLHDEAGVTDTLVVGSDSVLVVDGVIKDIF
jgi:hypothetical protein